MRAVLDRSPASPPRAKTCLVLFVVEWDLFGAGGLGGSGVDGPSTADRDLVGGSVDRVVTGSADGIDGYTVGPNGRVI